MLKIKSRTMAIYGLGIVASGMIRYFGSDGGETGLWFGIVMGIVAILSSFCFFTGKHLAANLFGWLVTIVVGGWFAYEALVKKGIEVAEWRQLILIAASIVVAIVLLRAHQNDADNTTVQ